MQSTSLPSSNVIAVTSSQKRVARRLANYAYSIGRAIRWRGVSLNGYESKAVRSHARQCMRESALRAAFWRNLIVTE